MEPGCFQCDLCDPGTFLSVSGLPVPSEECEDKATPMPLGCGAWHWGAAEQKSAPPLFFHCHHAKPEPSLRTHENTNITPVILESCSALVKVCKREESRVTFFSVETISNNEGQRHFG